MADLEEHKRKTSSEEQPHRHQDRVHTHGAVDPSLFTTERGVWAVKVSFLGLLATAVIQFVIVSFSGSVALLADTIHNLGDAATAIPLWIAFVLARRKPSQRFTYGLGRVEDLAGVAIVLTIAFSAVVAGYESITRLLSPRMVEYVWAVGGAAVIGFLGNEAVAQLRIKVGKEIGSAALVADGYHARVDGLTSLAVLFGAVGVWLGYPLADPIVGLVITAAIVRIIWKSGKSIFTRLLDGVDPDVVDEIRDTVSDISDVEDLTEVRVRWLGHRLHAELNIAVDPVLSVERGHEIADEVQHELLHRLRYLSNATIHVDPATASGERYHYAVEHPHPDSGERTN
jgi:cation diffusion facilitator family transporter